MEQEKSSLGAIALTVIIAAAVVGGGVYWSQQNQVEQEPLTTPEIEVTETEISYSPSKELNETLDLTLNQSRKSLFRGDAELAPTYKEFIANVSKTQDMLEDAIELYKEESKGKKVPGELETMFNNFELINEKLSMSLFRGDAELAPTYEEFGQTIRNINEEFTNYMEDYRNYKKINFYKSSSQDISFNYPSNWKLNENKTNKLITVTSPEIKGTSNVDYIPSITVYIPAENFDEYENTNASQIESKKMSIKKTTIKTNDNEFQVREYGQHEGVNYLIQADEHFVRVKSERYMTKEQEEGLGIILDSISF